MNENGHEGDKKLMICMWGKNPKLTAEQTTANAKSPERRKTYRSDYTLCYKCKTYWCMI